jgi:hypothetical protein
VGEQVVAEVELDLARDPDAASHRELNVPATVTDGEQDDA